MEINKKLIDLINNFHNTPETKTYCTINAMD